MQTYKNRIIVETGYLGANVSCIGTKKGLVLVDSPFLPEDARDWSRRIREQTRQEVAFQINTDHHFDHVMGNAFLSENIICHSTAARGIRFLRNKQNLKDIVRGTFPEIADALEPQLDSLSIPSPQITFDRKLTLDLGDATIALEFVGGHSPATILVHLVEDKVLFTGDNVEGQFPYFGQGRFGEWKQALRKMIALDVDLVVPGHGPVGGRDLIQKYVDFFEALEEEVGRFRAEGCATGDMAKKSRVIDFFAPTDEQGEAFRRSWIEEQYRFAAKQILEQ